MNSYEVHEGPISPEQADYIQRWLDEHKPVQFVSDEPDEDDGIGVWRALLWAVPVGLCFWALVVWVLW